jgi:4-hydroxybenzoate polyprenyltransferase
MGSGARRLSPALGLLRATHPLPAAAVTALVSGVAASRGASGWTLAWILMSTGVGQASVGWSNDYLDRDRDAAAGRTDKPIVSGEVRPNTVLAAAKLAFPLSVALSLPLGLSEALVMLLAVGSAWLYNFKLKSTFLSFLPYAVSFGLAPVYVWLATSEDLPPWWIPAATALLGAAAHFLNVIPDLESDRATDVRGLPHVLGLRRSLYLACEVLYSVLVIIIAGTWPPAPAQVVAGIGALVLITAVGWAGRSNRGRLGFRLTIASAGAIVAVFLLAPEAARF